METFNPFAAALFSKGGGLPPLFVLHLIAQAPRYGNEIMEQLEKRTLRRYTITPAGQAEVNQIKNIVMPKLTETVQVLQELINDLESAPEANEAEREGQG